MMNAVTTKEYSDLSCVGDGVRQLVGASSALRDALLNSLESYKRYLQRQIASEQVRQTRMREQAKLLLASGRIVEQGILGEREVYFVEEWEYPASIRQIERDWENALIAKSPDAAMYEASLAECLLASLQKQDKEQYDPEAPQLVRQQWHGSGFYTDYTPTITLRSRSEFRVLPRIGCLSQESSATALAELALRSPDDFRIVAFHHLRALVDIGTVLPLISKPLPLNDDASEDELNERFWGTVAPLHASYPVSHEAAHHPERAEPDEHYLPLPIAQDFLRVMVEWVQKHDPKAWKRFTEKPNARQKLPATRRGVQRLLRNSSKDMQVIALLKDGLSYRAIEAKTKVSRSTVERIAKANGLSSERPDTTRDSEGLSVKRGRRTH